ncbi:MAG: helix-turn-helix domain containing protein [Acidobacteria bacterium]|nr:helix-turn-helix domain containing protein [Acidobacteriota bacterium]
MPQRTRPPRPDPKIEALRVDGALNRHAAQITDPVFGAHPFFDARDLVQVKYEMLRRVEIDARPVTPTAAAFRLSRPSFYQAQRAFQQRGLAGLLPKKRGPHGGHKLTAEIVTFLQQAQARDVSLRPVDLAQHVADRFAVTVHPRSIERALARQEKKRQR